MSFQESWLDKMVTYFSPRAGADRAKAKLVKDTIQKIHKRRYEGAATGRRVDAWRTPSTSANKAFEGTLARLRDRSRDLVRNNPYAQSAITLIQSNTIGTGIVPQPKTLGKNSESIEQKAMETWKAWGETTACDFDGRLDFYGMQSLAMRETPEAGEILIRKRIVKPTSYNPLPLQLQFLEADFIDSNKNERGKDRTIIQGVEFDQQGRRVAYWLFETHPGEGFHYPESKRVLVQDLIHLYRMDRAGQVRGVPWGASSFIRLRDFDEYEDAQLVRQKIAACFAAFIYDSESEMDGDTNDEFQTDKIEPGVIEKLGPGKEVTFGVPPLVQGYAEYVAPTLRGIARGYGVPYEALTGDLSMVNFSSARLGWLEFQRLLEMWRYHTVIPHVCNGSWRWFIDAAELVGIELPATSAEWTPPRREMIDPVSETNATTRAIRSGLMTLSEAVRQSGYDPKEHFKQLKKDNEQIDALGLTLDSDPRKVTQVGIVQNDNQDQANPPAPNDEGQ